MKTKTSVGSHRAVAMEFLLSVRRVSTIGFSHLSVYECDVTFPKLSLCTHNNRSCKFEPDEIFHRRSVLAKLVCRQIGLLHCLTNIAENVFIGRHQKAVETHRRINTYSEFHS